MADVAIFPGSGSARVAGRSFAIAAGAAGTVRLADGPELRPLSFGERSALTRAARTAAAPAEELVQGVLAVSRSGDATHPAAAAIALHLAGAGGTELGFAAAQSLLARQLGWSADDVMQAPAAEIDALAADWHSSLQTGPSGWTRLVFGAPEPDQANDPEAVALSLAQDLLRRGAAGIDPDSLPPLSGLAPRSREARNLSGRTPVGAPDLHERAAGLEKDSMSSGDAASNSLLTPPVENEAVARQTAPLQPPLEEPQSPAGFLPGQTDARPTRAEGSARRTGPHADRPDQSLMWTVSAPVKPAPQPESRAEPSTAALVGTGFLPSPAPADQDIWARQPLPLPLARRSRMAVSASGVQTEPRAFSGWFDDAPAEIDSDRPDLPQPAPWVWSGAVASDTSAPELPHIQPLPAYDDTSDALAEALHLAADLRGIAP